MKKGRTHMVTVTVIALLLVLSVLPVLLNGCRNTKKTAIGQAIVDYPDAVAMAALVWDDFITDSVKCEARCITDAGDAYGQVIFYKEGSTYEGVVQLDNVNARVVRSQNG